MNLRGRLRRLERERGEPGCPACRDRRGRIVWTSVGADGTAPPGEEMPPPCGRCGKVPEQVIRYVHVDVDVPAPEEDVP
jgi:hypothetical protein